MIWVCISGYECGWVYARVFFVEGLILDVNAGFREVNTTHPLSHLMSWRMEKDSHKHRRLVVPNDVPWPVDKVQSVVEGFTNPLLGMQLGRCSLLNMARGEG